MQSPSSQFDKSKIPLGQRRGVSEVAYIALDLCRARPEPEPVPLQRAYPSPPMSGSPPTVPRSILEAGNRGHGSYQPASHDVYRHPSIAQGRSDSHSVAASSLPGQLQSQGPSAPFPRSYGPNVDPNVPQYGYHRFENPSPRQSNMHHGTAMMSAPQYQPPQPQPHPIQLPPQLPQLQQIHSSHTYAHPVSLSGQHQHPTAPTQTRYSTGSIAHPPRSQPQRGRSPSSSVTAQRKPKQHVHSACMPCKKAHLR